MLPSNVKNRKTSECVAYNIVINDRKEVDWLQTMAIGLFTVSISCFKFHNVL